MGYHKNYTILNISVTNDTHAIKCFNFFIKLMFHERKIAVLITVGGR